MIDLINHVPDRIAEAEYGEEGGIYTRFSLHYTDAFFTCSWWVVLQYRFSVFVVVAQEGSFSVMVFGRATKNFYTCSCSSSNAAGFCMLFCYFGDLSGMLEYHAIEYILCSAFT